MIRIKHMFSFILFSMMSSVFAAPVESSEIRFFNNTQDTIRMIAPTIMGNELMNNQREFDCSDSYSSRCVQVSPSSIYISPGKESSMRVISNVRTLHDRGFLNGAIVTYISSEDEGTNHFVILPVEANPFGAWISAHTLDSYGEHFKMAAASLYKGYPRFEQPKYTVSIINWNSNETKYPPVIVINSNPFWQS